MSKEKKQSFMQGIITLMFSQVLIKILGLFYKLYLTNKNGFGDAGNAIYNSGFQIYALLLTISSIGVPNAVAKLISEKLSVGDNRGAQKIFKVAFAFFSVVGFTGSALLFCGSDFIANVWLQIPEAKLTLIILAPSIFFVSLISVLRGYFNGHENMKPMAQSQTIEQFTKTICTVAIVELICFFMGNKDTTAPFASIKYVYDNVKSKDVELWTIDNINHGIFNNYRYQDIKDIIFCFLTRKENNKKIKHSI